jgi:hypothetical protein
MVISDSLKRNLGSSLEDPPRAWLCMFILGITGDKMIIYHWEIDKDMRVLADTHGDRGMPGYIALTEEVLRGII